MSGETNAFIKGSVTGLLIGIILMVAMNYTVLTIIKMWFAW